jgi:hypothetical protein
MTDHRTPPDPALPDATRLPPATPPAVLEDRIVAALARQGQLRPTRRLAPWLVAAGALAAAVAALVLFTRDAPEAPHFLLLIAEDDRYRGPADSTEALARVREYGAWAGDLAREGRLVSAGELAPGGIAVHADGRAPADAGGVSGYFLIRAGSAAEAERLAGQSPHLRYGGTVVVRSVVH